VCDARLTSLLLSRYIYIYIATFIYIYTRCSRKSMQTTFGNLAAVQLFPLFPVSFSYLFVSFLLRTVFYCCISFVPWPEKGVEIHGMPHPHPPLPPHTHTLSQAFSFHLALTLMFRNWIHCFPHTAINLVFLGKNK